MSGIHIVCYTLHKRLFSKSYLLHTVSTLYIPDSNLKLAGSYLVTEQGTPSVLLFLVHPLGGVGDGRVAIGGEQVDEENQHGRQHDKHEFPLQGGDTLP